MHFIEFARCTRAQAIRTHAISEEPGSFYHVYSLIARYLEENVPPGGVRLSDARRRRPDLDSHHKNKAETQPTPFLSVIINERIPYAPLAKAFQGLIRPAIE